MKKRNRSEGWKYAKKTGHLNEDMAAVELDRNSDLQKRFLALLGKENIRIKRVYTRGIHQINVPSVFGDTTKSKSDLDVVLEDGDIIRVSLKKSLDGQAYLISPNRFINGFEKIYNKIIPTNVKEAINLFWGDVSHEQISEIVNEYGSKYDKYELYKNRIVGAVLKRYNENYYHALLNWFKENISEIFDFCFCKGLAKEEIDWVQVIWYKDEMKGKIDDLFLASDIKENLSKFGVEYGKTNGETTIQLPFGFVQWHSPTKSIPGSMQFHHSYEKNSEAIERI